MSKRKSETARLNGAKSKGPKTPGGKARSSRNAVSHGLTANFPLLDHESGDEFQSFLDAYIERYRPSDVVELDLVHTMAIARWRLRRITAIETALFENKMLTSQEQIDEEWDSIENHNRLAWVFEKMAGESRALALLMRYEASLNRLYERTAKQLKVLQSSLPPNEPTGPVTSDSPSTSEQEGTADFGPREASASPQQPDIARSTPASATDAIISARRFALSHVSKTL
jgi:hypothetical protein